MLGQLRQHLKVALQRIPATAPAIRGLLALVHRVADVLSVKHSTARKVRHRFDRLIEEIRQKREHARSPLKKAALRHMEKTAHLFRPGLFVTYDHPEIPPTDNDLEGVFRGARGLERRITGHKSTARRLARDGDRLIAAQERLRKGPISADLLAAAATPGWREHWLRHQEQRRRADRPRRLRRDLRKVLRSLRSACREIGRPSARAP